MPSEMEPYVVGVDLGGTKVEACLLDAERRILKRSRKPAEAAQGLDVVIANILDVVRDAAEGRRYSGVGIGTPGTYIEAENKIYGSPHTTVYETPGFMGLLQKRLDVPLLIENDANCLALAEYFASCAGIYRNVMAVILGTGVGSGLILDGKLYRGSRGGAGEIGHSSLDVNQGRLCECGRRGCVEAYLSGPSLSRRYKEMCGVMVAPLRLVELYREGNECAVRFFEESARIMGEFLANAVNILDLDAVILGGGISNIPVWYDKVPHQLRKSLFGVPRPDVPLIKARLGDSAGVAGAGYLVLRRLGIMAF